MQVWNYPKPCNWCGKKAKKHFARYRDPSPYNGNLKVIRSDKHFDNYVATLWDGESYAHKHDFFCTDKCAVAYAEAVAKGQYYG